MRYRIDGKKVSKPWYIVLRHARRHDVPFMVTDGRRTLRDQWARVRKHGLWSTRNPTGAAFPSLRAPHINFNRANHAIDVNALDGGSRRLVTFLDKHGCPSACRPIASEPWHIQISRGELVAYSNKIARARKRRGLEL